MNGSEENGLRGYWRLKGDCEDHSGNGNHGINFNVDLRTGGFNGIDSYLLVEHSGSLDISKGDFAICCWVHTERDVTDVIGDIVSKYDPSRQKGFTLSINSSAGGYNSHGDDKHVCFGIDDGRMSQWQDCGRPSETSNYVSNSLTVYEGGLYAATTDGKSFQEWSHVYRYGGNRRWEDCGRVGNLKTRGVGPLIVHGGKLYAATWSIDWTRVNTDDLDFCRVYRYGGGSEWADCGQPGEYKRIMCMASYGGRLYVGGDDARGGTYKVFVHDGGTRWQVSGEFPSEGPRMCFPHAMGVHDGRLYVGFPAVYGFDGEGWEYVGVPVGCTQVHSLEVFGGKLHAGTWPEGKVAAYMGGDEWEDLGRPGDSTEVNALVVYNGKLYAGSIPRSEVWRYDGRKGWTRMARFFAPEGWEPAPVDASVPNYSERVKEWSRLTSLTVYDGRLFASTGSCTGSVLDAPCDVRGKVFSMEAGKCVSYDHDLGSGWRYVAAVKERGTLKLYVDGTLKARSPSFDPGEYDISNREPLRIGSGELDYFCGKIQEIRIYSGTLSDRDVRTIYEESRRDYAGGMGSQ
jgi:hypothetical protein